MAKLLAYFGLGPEDMHSMLQLIKDGGLMKEAGNTESVRAACADFHRGTWFVSNYSTGHKLATTSTGSRPGESWADAIFAYVYARAMGTLVERADGESLLSYVEHNPRNGIFRGPLGQVASIARDGTWADDSVLPIEDRSPGQLVAKLKRLASLAISTLEEFGLSPNLKPGKTSAILSLVGKGVVEARRAATIRGRPAILLEDLAIELPIVPQYVHLGAIIDNKLTLKGESRHRLALVGSAYDQGKRLVFQNKTIPLQIRASLFETGVRSTLFNLSIWMPEGEAWTKLAGGYTRCLRRLLATTYKGAHLFKIPLPMVHVLTDSWSLDLVAMRSRLGLLAALVTNGPDVLWAVLQQEQVWLAQVKDDLQKLWDFDRTWPEVVRDSWPAWVRRIQESPAAFKRGVRRLLQARHKQDVKAARIHVALWMMYRFALSQTRVPPATAKDWSCRMCKTRFKSKGGLGAHLFKAHGRRAAYRACVHGTVCAACGTQYWSETRLAVHLRDNPWCSNALRDQGLLAPSTRPGFGSREWRKLETEQYTPAPTEKVVEPQGDGSGHRWSAEAENAYRAICGLLFEAPSWLIADDLVSAIIEVFAGVPLYAAEENDVCSYIAGEVRDLQGSDPQLLWDAESIEVVLRGLAEAPSVPRAPAIDSCDCGDTLQDFSVELAKVQWDAIVRGFLSDCVTPETTPEVLEISWEDGEEFSSGVVEAPTAVDDPLCFVPLQLGTVWRRVTQGTVSSITAPQSFWEHPLAAPFAALRGKACN